MATDLQLMYLQERAGRACSHHAALRRLSRRTGIDAATIGRCLHRARRADEADARRARRAA